MRFCSICGVSFAGRGSYCTYHNPAFQSYFNNSEDKHNTKYHSTHALTKHRPRTPLARPYLSSALEPYIAPPRISSNTLALAGYDAPLPLSPYTYNEDALLHPTHLKPVSHVFDRLTHNHAISQLTYTVDVYGTRSLTAMANLEREQCGCCGEWFRDRRGRVEHERERVGCADCGVCFGWDDVGIHAEEEKHDRCFVRGCRSVYRLEGRWKGAVVEKHVRDMHT